MTVSPTNLPCAFVYLALLAGVYLGIRTFLPYLAVSVLHDTDGKLAEERETQISGNNIG